MKFNGASVEFVKHLLDEATAQRIDPFPKEGALDFFSTVRIKDSTIIEVDESLADRFKGFGNGNCTNSKAAVRIQFEFDIKRNSICDLAIGPAAVNDSTDAIKKSELVEKNDLIIRDLGYYSHTAIDRIIDNEAFLISRLYPNVAVRLQPDDDGKVDFKELRQRMIRTGEHTLDTTVFIGKKKRPVRMIVVLMPPDVYEKRINQRSKDNKHKGYKISNEFRDRAYFNIFITNVPGAVLPAEDVLNLYKIRWQIELIFKSWKSILQLEKFRKIKLDRFLTTLYAKMLWFVVNWNFYSCCRNEFYARDSKLLSVYKCFQSLNEKRDELRRSIRVQAEGSKKILEELVRKFRKNHWVEKRKNRYKIESIFEYCFVD